MSSLTKVWEGVKEMLEDGYSLIPVRDKDQGNFKAKTPYSKWEEFQSKRISQGELWQLMDDKKTEAISIICGKISGNLEVIDIDSKHYEGISIRIFKEIRALRPDLYDKIRVHKTPSGGYHILYRIADHEPEGNQKLADRATTDKEKEEQRKAGRKNPAKKQNFLETRGEGGYILAPPSLNYSVHLERPTPLISWSDRCELIAICRSFNEVITPSKAFTSTKKTESFYTESPWEDFNNRGDISGILKTDGWEEHSYKNSDRVYFVRPNSKSKGIHASFHLEHRYFWAFTTSTELEEQKAYKPVDLLCILSFKGDKSATYKYLVDNGFGKVKKSIENRLVKKQATNKGNIPKNFSKEAVKTFEDLKASIVENMPYGIFWELDEKGKTIISREDLYSVSNELGFRIYNNSILVRINGSVISEQTESDYFNTLKGYIWEEEAAEYKNICNSFESFLQKSGKFTISRLKELDKSLLIFDTIDISYKFYRNGYISITKEDISFSDYSTIHGLVWEHKVQDRDWNLSAKSGGVYVEYLSNAIGVTGYLKRIIGNLSIDYKDEASSYIIILIEKVPDPKEGGGSGKNIFGNILKYSTTIKTVPGSQVKFDENFLQPWNFQRIYFLADLPKRIDWSFLKEMTTGTGIHKRLYKDQVDVESEDMPKLLLNTNYSYEDSDGGLIRRIRHVEFTPYYTINGGVDQVHGKMFPKDFDQEDWNGYDHFIAECIQEAIKNKLKIERTELSDESWIKKFQMQYGDLTYMFINDNIEDWVSMGFVSNSHFNEKYISFCNDFDVPAKYRLSAKAIANSLKDYCHKFNIFIDTSLTKSINSVTTRGKQFGNNNKIIQENDPF